MTRASAYFYNLDNGRPPKTVTTEVRAILDHGPIVAGVVEAGGYQLPDVPGFKLIRDRRTAGRANVAAYVAGHLDLDRVQWDDLDQQWSRPKYPHLGKHPARSVLSFRLGGRDGLQVVVAHQPPRRTDNTWRAQTEGVNAISALMSPWARGNWDTRTRARQEKELQRPRLALGDWNRRKWEKGPGPATVARRIDGKVAGFRIDAAVHRHLRDVRASYPSHAGRVRLGSDHGHALRVDFKVKGLD